jgi:hypothetical protein
MNLEDELRAALKREAAPPDFAAGVLWRARAVRAESRSDFCPGLSWWRRPMVLAFAACLLIAAIVPLGISERHRREERRAMEAKARLVTALTIANVQLRHMKEKLQRNKKSAL